MQTVHGGSGNRLVKVYNYPKAHLQIACFVWPAVLTVQLAVTQMKEARGMQKKNT